MADSMEVARNEALLDQQVQTFYQLPGEPVHQFDP